MTINHQLATELASQTQEDLKDTLVYFIATLIGKDEDAKALGSALANATLDRIDNKGPIEEDDAEDEDEEDDWDEDEEDDDEEDDWDVDASLDLDRD